MEDKEIQQVISKIQDKLKPFIFEYLSWFVPQDKMPKDKKGKEMMACLNHHGNGLDMKHKHMKYYPETGTFHCFACGKTMNFFDLANLYEGKPLKGKEFYTENVKYLCEKFGIDTEELDSLKIGNEELRNTEYYFITREIADYITANVDERFIKARNITKESANLFQVGSIPKIEDFENFLKQFKKELLIDLGVLKDDGTLNMAIFSPTKLIMSIKDINGNVVSFSAREMIYTVANARTIFKKYYNFNDKVLASIKKEKDIEKFIDLTNMEEKHIKFLKRCVSMPRYVHTKVSKIFKKREVLYGYYELKNKLNKSSNVYIIEGNIDVITGYQRGIYCMSVGGDALTDEQYDIVENKLSNYTNNVVISFDNDLAGKNATYKYAKFIIDNMKKQELNNKYFVLEYKDGALKDIDENLKKFNGLKEFAEPISLFNYYLKESLENKTEKELDVISDFIKIISSEESPLIRKNMIVELHQALDKVATSEERENKFTIKDLENEVYFLVNKANEKAQKLAFNKIDKLRNKIKVSTSEEIIPLFKSTLRELEDTDMTGVKSVSIFDTSLNKFRENQEKKYSEDPIEFNCGFDMFNNRSWTGDELIVLIAKPHIGKTQFMTNISKNFIQMNGNTAVLYISTDDNSRRIENNFIAQTGRLNKDFVNEPKNNTYFGLNSQYKNKLLYQEQFKKTIGVIEGWIKSKRLVILESASGIKSLDLIVDAIEEFANEKSIKDFQKLVIIDSANKVQVTGVTDEYSKLLSVSSDLKTAGQKNHCMIMANFETIKFASRRHKTTFNNIKGSASIEYDVDFAITLNNPMAELPNPDCVWEKDDKKLPVLVPYVSKSKPGGDINKAYFYKIDTSTSVIEEFSDEELKDIKSKWFSDNNNKEHGYVSE